MNAINNKLENATTLGFIWNLLLGHSGSLVAHLCSLFTSPLPLITSSPSLLSAHLRLASLRYGYEERRDEWLTGEMDRGWPYRPFTTHFISPVSPSLHLFPSSLVSYSLRSFTIRGTKERGEWMKNEVMREWDAWEAEGAGDKDFHSPILAVTIVTQQINS